MDGDLLCRHDLAIGKDAPDFVNAVIEIPRSDLGTLPIFCTKASAESTLAMDGARTLRHVPVRIVQQHRQCKVCYILLQSCWDSPALQMLETTAVMP